MTDLPKIPPLSPELVEALNKRFPERCPDPSWSDRDVWRRVGQRETVRFLIEELKRQTDNSIEGEPNHNVRVRR